MASLKASSSRSSIQSASSHTAHYIPPSPPTSSESHGSSASSSKVSLDMADEENDTIRMGRPMSKKVLGKKKSQEDDLRLLAISTHMTELSYSISDIQTRIFEIQELRHRSQSSGDTAGTTSTIDKSLMSLDERLDTVSKGIQSVNEALEPLLQSTATPTVSSQNGDTNDNAVILRKHAALMAEWEAVQDESDVLREELKEDKWLTVFRTVTDQADGMMSSLEKAVNRCQEFIWQVHRRGFDETSLSASQHNEKAPLTVSLETFNGLSDSFEAKKKHYMPATSKVLSIIDKGVRDRVTKNGETLRRHAESAQRWKNLRDRITRTDAEMEVVRKILLSGDATPSENGSNTSCKTSGSRSAYLATPPSGSRMGKGNGISRSISPLRKFAKKITGSSKGSPSSPVTPLSVEKRTCTNGKSPSSEPVKTIRKQRTSIFAGRGEQSAMPTTPDRPGHKYSQSLTPDPSPRALREDGDTNTLKGRSAKQPWNSSTKLNSEKIPTFKGHPRRAPSASGMYGRQFEDIPPVPALGASYRRSLSRTSMASSRPWSPVTSSVSTSQSSQPPLPTFRPPSRAQTPSTGFVRATTPGITTTPKPRPKTPSHIPAPAKGRTVSSTQSEAAWDDTEFGTLKQRCFSPALSVATSPGGSQSHPPRPPSRSMIPVPSLHLSSPSRPGSSMTNYRSESPTFRIRAGRAQTPEATLRARVQQIPVLSAGTLSRGSRSALQIKAPPSSFRDGSVSRTPSRPGSRAGAYTPQLEGGVPVHEYVPVSSKDPLDMEVANVVNSMWHGLLVERVDPPLRGVPKGEEVSAKYAISNALGTKTVTCKLTTLARAKEGMSTKKVMVRVGGGWQDLQLYMLNRQAGM